MPGDAYLELYVYAMGRAGFILQHVLDAQVAQTARSETKPIALIFALAGLFLRVEKQFTGRQVQRAHRELARERKVWPAIPLPADRGRIAASDVLAVPPGAERDLAIDAWCRSVWDAFKDSHSLIGELLRAHHII